MDPMSQHRCDWMPLPPQQPAVILTSDLKSLVRSPVGASNYSLLVLPKLF